MVWLGAGFPKRSQNRPENLLGCRPSHQIRFGNLRRKMDGWPRPRMIRPPPVCQIEYTGFLLGSPFFRPLSSRLSWQLLPPSDYHLNVSEETQWIVDFIGGEPDRRRRLTLRPKGTDAGCLRRCRTLHDRNRHHRMRHCFQVVHARVRLL